MLTLTVAHGVVHAALAAVLVERSSIGKVYKWKKQLDSILENSIKKIYDRK